jgi:hypothetical protein
MDMFARRRAAKVEAILRARIAAVTKRRPDHLAYFKRTRAELAALREPKPVWVLSVLWHLDGIIALIEKFNKEN